MLQRLLVQPSETSPGYSEPTPLLCPALPRALYLKMREIPRVAERSFCKVIPAAAMLIESDSISHAQLEIRQTDVLHHVQFHWSSAWPFACYPNDRVDGFARPPHQSALRAERLLCGRRGETRRLC